MASPSIHHREVQAHGYPSTPTGRSSRYRRPHRQVDAMLSSSPPSSPYTCDEAVAWRKKIRNNCSERLKAKRDEEKALRRGILSSSPDVFRYSHTQGDNRMSNIEEDVR